MRKRRVILYDDDPAILNGLTLFFEELGYDVTAFRQPVECPVYDEGEPCDRACPCGDLMVTDLEMPGMSGIEMLRHQFQRQCKLPIKNKAVLTGNLDPVSREILKELGCAVFLKPVRLSVLAVWIRECEERMDLSRPLGVRRRERREPCSNDAIFRFENDQGLCAATVVNRSDSGLGIRTERPLAVAQVLDLWTHMPLTSSRLQVRWTRPDTDGRYLSGMSCC